MASEQSWAFGGDPATVRTMLAAAASVVMIGVGVARRDLPVIAIGAGLLGIPSISIVIAKNGKTNGHSKQS